MIDLMINDAGELMYDTGIADIDRVTGDALLRQICVCRIKSVVGDWFNSDIGANLEEYLGQELGYLVVGDIKGAITNSCTFDGLLDEGDVFIIAQRNDYNSLSFAVFLKGKFSDKPSLINVEIDIAGGVKINYDNDTQ